MKLLLDEHLWPGLVEMVSNLVPGNDLESVHSFDGGALVNQADSLILERARLEWRVLVTCDVNTIPEELRERAHAGKSHAGVVFLSSKSFIQNDHGSIAKALASLISKTAADDWTNRVVFLKKSGK
jgi:hypothetical protein